MSLQRTVMVLPIPILNPKTSNHTPDPAQTQVNSTVRPNPTAQQYTESQTPSDYNSSSIAIKGQWKWRKFEWKQVPQCRMHIEQFRQYPDILGDK